MKDSNKNVFLNQDFKQKIASFSVVVIEIYKVLIASLLILFVPQKCGDHVCSYKENIQSDNNFYTTGLIFNFLTLLMFIILYGVEIKRENCLITYLEVNIDKPCDDLSVGEALNNLAVNKKEAILSLDKIYNQLGKCCIILFTANSVLSGIIIYNYYLDNQTTTSFATNIFFMISKIYDVYVTVNTEKNVFYSAYLRTKVQYNDVDPDEMINITDDNNIIVIEPNEITVCY